MDARHYVLPIAILLALEAPAQNNYFFVSGNVMTGVTWHAPQSLPPGCPSTSSLVQFFSAPFFSDTTASTYLLTLYFESFQSSFVYVYQDAFDPQTACTGMIAFANGPTATIQNVHLDANRQYFVVTSEASLFGGGGSFQVLINGPAGSHMFPGFVGPLSSTVSAISLANGGVQPWILAAGPAHAGEAYLVLGSVSGTSPGIPITGTLVLPLNLDFWLEFTLAHPNVAPLHQSSGVLSASGTAQGFLALPPGLPASLVGFQADHAFVTLDSTSSVTFVSNPIPLMLVP